MGENKDRDNYWSDKGDRKTLRSEEGKGGRD